MNDKKTTTGLTITVIIIIFIIFIITYDFAHKSILENRDLLNFIRFLCITFRLTSI